MQKKGFGIIVGGDKGAFMQCEMDIELRWEDVELTPSEIKHICAYHEWETKHHKNSFLNLFDTAA